MKTRIKQFKLSPRVAVFAIAANFICAASNAGPEDTLNPSQNDMLNNNMPKDRVLNLPSPEPRKIQRPEIQPAIPTRSPENVRLTRNGVFVDTPAAFRAKVTGVLDDSVIRFDDGHSIALRLPKGHRYVLSNGDNLSVEYQPTTTAGSDENSLELRMTNGPDTNKQNGTLLAAIVQRGGDKPLVIDTHEFTVVQGKPGKVVLTTKSETTTTPDTYVKLKDSKKTIALTRNKAIRFETMGNAFTITLINSLHVTPNTKDNLSDEGPRYWLEYVVTENKP